MDSSKSSLQELVAEQLASAERMVASSRALAERLSANHAPLHSSPDCWHIGSPGGAGSSVGFNSLSEPLLSHSPMLHRVVGEHGLHFHLRRYPSKNPSETEHAEDSEKHEEPALRRFRTLTRGPMFPNPTAMKEQVQLALRTQNYDAESFYSDKGCWQEIARSSTFKNLTFCVIALNAIWIGIDTDLNKQELLLKASWEFQLVETLFCVFFSFEIITRFQAFRNKCHAFKDGWFIFDFVLLGLMWWGSWGTSVTYLLLGGGAHSSTQNMSMLRILRLFRLSRIARMARLLKDVPELMILIKGMALAIRAVFSTLCLLLITIYIFAIAFTQMLAGAEGSEGCFETVPQAMNCLLLNGVFADQASLITQMLDVHWAYYAAILVYMTIGSLTVLNMLIGVMCEVVGTVSQAENQSIMVQSLTHKISKVLQETDTNNDQLITPEEFQVLLQSAECMQALDQVNVDVAALVDFADFIFRDRQSLTCAEFVDTLLQFRGDNAATVKDVVDIRRFITSELESLAQQLHGGPGVMSRQESCSSRG